MNRIYLLLSVGLMACVQQPLETPTPVLDWAGTYQFSSSSNYGANLEIEKGGKYLFSSVICTGFAERVSGHYVAKGPWLELSDPFPFPDESSVDRLKMVVENKDQFLIPESMTRFIGRDFPTPAAGFVRGGYERRLTIEQEYHIAANQNP